MSVALTCDGPRCVRTVNADHPNGFWLKLERLAPQSGKEYHYCSFKCAHSHTYLLISGDNGK